MSVSTQTSFDTWKGFDLAALAQFGIRRSSDGIEIPYLTREGEHFRTKVFSTGPEKRSWWREGGGQIPYGLEQLTRTGREAIVLTEGESDALALRLAFPDVTALGIPGASSWRTEWRVYVEDFPRIYLSFDADEAGRKLRDAVREDVPAYRPINLPEGADTRDVIQQLGKRAYKLLVDEADADFEQRCAWRRLDEAVRARQAVDNAWRKAAA